MPALALTLDDAPSVSEPGVPFDAARMDRARELLVRRGVTHCVAFVVSSRAVGHEAVLERWLAAGFELGNHTHEHRPAGEQSARQFAESLSRCDALLQSVGAFDGGRPKWFRFPRLDRGRDAAHRARLARECAQLGYRIAPATIDFFDYAYEAQLAAALARGNDRDVRLVAQRFLHTCMREAEAAASAFLAHAPGLAHVGFAHFGPVGDLCLGAMLDLLAARSFEPCPLSAALEHPVYARFDADFDGNGLILPPGPRGLGNRLRRKLAVAVERLAWLDRRRYGPRSVG